MTEIEYQSKTDITEVSEKEKVRFGRKCLANAIVSSTGRWGGVDP